MGCHIYFFLVNCAMFFIKNFKRSNILSECFWLQIFYDQIVDNFLFPFVFAGNISILLEDTTIFIYTLACFQYKFSCTADVAQLVEQLIRNQ